MPIKDPVAELTKALRAAGARPTFDPQRSTALACVLCGTISERRQLVTVGKYTRRMGGGLLPGDNIDRPMCAGCELITREP